MANDNHDEAHLRNLMRFVHAQDSGGIYEGTGTYAQALQEVKAGISGALDMVCVSTDERTGAFRIGGILWHQRTRGSKGLH